MKKLIVFGTGHLAKALLPTFLAQSYYQIILIHYNEEVIQQLKQQFPECEVKSKIDWELQRDDVLLLLVKPQQARKALLNVGVSLIKKCLIISLMAGINTKSLFLLTQNQRIIRVMPNIANSTNNGANAVFINPNLAKQDVEIVKTLFSKSGKLYELLNEEEIDVFAAILSCSAYFYIALKGMVDTLISHLGFDPLNAMNLMHQIINGSISLLEPDSYQSLSEGCSKAASKGGITEQGIKVLQENDISKIFSQAILSGVAKAQAFQKDLNEEIQKGLNKPLT